MIRTAALLLLLPLSLALLAATPVPTPDPLDLAATGKTAFAAKCGACHGLDRATGTTKDAAGWNATVSRMIDKSPGSFAVGDGAAISAYLAGRSLFGTACTSCHGADRADAGRDRANWKATVARMQKYAKGKIGDGDAVLITGYLAAERPAKP